MAQPLDFDAFLKSCGDYEEELKPIDAWSTLVCTLDGIPIARDLPRLKGGPLHQWLEDVANAVDPLDLVETLDRELRRRVGMRAPTSQSAEQLLIALCMHLERCAWASQAPKNRKQR